MREPATVFWHHSRITIRYFEAFSFVSQTSYRRRPAKVRIVKVFCLGDIVRLGLHLEYNIELRPPSLVITFTYISLDAGSQHIRDIGQHLSLTSTAHCPSQLLPSFLDTTRHFRFFFFFYTFQINSVKPPPPSSASVLFMTATETEEANTWDYSFINV